MKQSDQIQSPEEVFLNLAAFEPRSRVDGPGLRATIWVQGCSIKCPGCINADFIPNRPKKLIPVKTLAQLIIKDKEIDGISFSGGEPFDQACSLAILCDLICRQRPELTYFSYSGYYLPELREKQDPWIDRLLDHLDILVAGPFILAKRGSFKWRGSGNKQIHFLSERYSSEILNINSTRTQIHFTSGGGGTIHGFGFNDEPVKTLKKILAEKGIRLAIKK